MLRGSVKYQGFWASGARSSRRAVEELRQAATEACMDAIAFWHRQFLPEHFETSAVRKYGYQKRSAKYMRRKARQKRHQKPLVWSGRLRQQVMRFIRIEPLKRSAAGGARGVMTGPRYLWAYRKDYRQPDKAREITTVSSAEEAVLAQAIEAGTARRLNQMQQVFTRRRFA